MRNCNTVRRGTMADRVPMWDGRVPKSHPRPAAASLDAASDLLEQAGGDEDTLRARVGVDLGLAHTKAGRLASSRGAARQAAALARRAGDVSTVVRALGKEALVLVQALRMAEAEDLVVQARATVARTGSASERLAVGVIGCGLARYRGALGLPHQRRGPGRPLDRLGSPPPAHVDRRRQRRLPGGGREPRDRQPQHLALLAPGSRPAAHLRRQGHGAHPRLPQLRRLRHRPAAAAPPLLRARPLRHRPLRPTHAFTFSLWPRSPASTGCVAGTRSAFGEGAQDLPPGGETMLSFAMLTLGIVGRYS